MAQRCIFSRHIPFRNMEDDDVSAIIDDIRLFNHLKWKCTSEMIKDNKQDKPDGIDLRRKENAALRDTLPESLHIRMKRYAGCTDYFVNSAERLASGIISSVKTNTKEYISDLRSEQKAIDADIKRINRQIAQLEKVKQRLILATKEGNQKKIKSLPYCRYRDGIWEILLFGKVVKTYENSYLFELLYLDPKIRTLKARARLMANRSIHLEKKLNDMGNISICYGSKKLYRKQNTVYEEHDVWKRSWQKKRNSSMTLVGRKDSRNGNFLCTYDINRKVLIYRSTKNRYIEFPNAEFPYKQDELNKVVTNGYSAIGWTIEITGQSFLIRCVYTIPEGNRLSDTSLGVIGIDTNVDNISWTETDDTGAMISHGIVYYDLRNKSSEQAEHILSEALEKIYAKCSAAGKPLVMEDLKIKKKFDKNKKKNRKISSFAYRKITELACSKSNKYGIEIQFIDPAYTSQAGKILFMRDNGLSVHEAASYVIARRGMNIYDKVPDYIYERFTKRLKESDFRQQWYAASKYIRQFKPDDIYNGALTREMVTALNYIFD